MIHLLALAASIAFVPLDDRPVAAQLPPMLGRIAGVTVDTPAAPLLGRYLQAGQSDQIVAWLGAQARRPEANAFVVSTDMLSYGGLIASRVPDVAYAGAAFRLRTLSRIRANKPSAWIAGFATVMRLAPTGIPAGTPFFAADPAWRLLQQYANLPQPVPASDAQTERDLRTQLGPVLNDYLATRERDLGVDRLLLQLTAQGTIDRLAIGQDDAGPVGLHVNEVAQLRQIVANDPSFGGRVSIEPGADELGMALVAQAIARTAGWTPHVRVVYSTPSGALTQDPLEFAPISVAIDGLIGLCGGVRDDGRPDLALFVRVPKTTPQEDGALSAAMTASLAAGTPVALADLTFLNDDQYASQAAFAKNILATGLASRLDAYASWNTNANTVGTALAEAVAAGAGRRRGTYDDLAHRTFTFMRFLDDY
ncbi:MAG: DUF4127 family protein, partial [Candidatus Eremiobacteraeota bacterium]|nr:DUF4127 family protein [Candidatus Eremiobacteraeota bacterium]